MYLLSVIIPVYNAEKYIDRCMAPLTEMGPEVQIILADDGSSDLSLSKCIEYEKRYSNVTVLHEENRGPSAARNLALTKAEGKYIIFCDADDRLEPGILDVIRAEDVFSFDLMQFGIISEFGDYHRKEPLISEERCGCTSSDIHEIMALILGLDKKGDPAPAYFGLVTCKIYKRDLIKDICFDTKAVGEDTLFAIMAADKAKTFCFIPDHYYHYSAVWGTYSRRYFPGIVPMAESLLVHLKDEISEDMHESRLVEKAYYHYCFNIIRWCFGSALKADEHTLKNELQLSKDIFSRKVFKDAAHHLPLDEKGSFAKIENRVLRFDLYSLYALLDHISRKL